MIYDNHFYDCVIVTNVVTTNDVTHLLDWSKSAFRCILPTTICIVRAKEVAVCATRILRHLQ